mmetsp:Transcript_1040/g.2927  ORF Transcript_1040/g.2927 Transcript_1040/m.2927 type:complete len:392 (-) Transcript_1040:53-1228(-)
MPGASDPALAQPQHTLGNMAKRDWLFCIPVQVGPATSYARSTHHWLFLILGIQAFLCFLRFVVLYDFTGGLWMALVVALGLYAYRQDMNITYVCCWGLACAANGIFDILSLLLPWMFGLAFRGLLDTLVMMATPLAYGMGTLFAWHLYHDYEEAHGEKTMLGKYDPMGKYFDRYDPEHIPLASAKQFDSRFGTHTTGGVAKAQQGAYAAAGSAAVAGGAASAAGIGIFGRMFGGGAKAATDQGQAMAQGQLNVAGQQAAGAAVVGRGFAMQGQEQAHGAMAQGQQQMAQHQQAASGWFGSMQASGQSMFETTQQKAEQAAAGAGAEASRRAVAEGAQQGKDQAAGFFSSLMGGAQQQGAALQQQGAAMQQQAGSNVYGDQRQGQSRFQANY